VFSTNRGKNSGQAMPPDTLAALRGTLPIEQVNQISTPSCDSEFCRVEPQMPAARACPYTLLQHDPTPAEQRAARRDSRCDGVGEVAHYFAGGLRSTRGMTFVIDEAAAGALANLSPQDAAQATAALHAGKVIVGDSRYLDNDQVTLTLAMAGPSGSRSGGKTQTLTAPGFALPHPPGAPVTMMTPQTARSLGLSSSVFATLATTSRMPTVAEQDRAQAALGNEFAIQVEQGPPTTGPTLLVLAIVAGVITLAAAAIATGLAAADGRSDLAILAAVGASPRIRRALSLSQSGVIAGLGSLIGAVAGLGASTAVLFALNQRYAGVWPAPTPYPIKVPWLNVGVALLVVPLIAMLGAGLLTRSRLPIERRQ
jgi:putative ABC transport system permease protein